jgi:copper chaperone CopZ
MKKTFQLETLSCPTCATKIEGMLKKTSGVEEAEVLFTSSKVKVTFNDEQIQSDQIKKRITNLGYDVIGEK